MKGLNVIKTTAQDSIDELKNFDWNDILDIESIGVWPGVVKLVLSIALFAGCLGGGYWFHIKNLQTNLSEVSAKEVELRTQFEAKAVQASNLEIYQQQMVEMEETFESILRALPGETEVPGLLDDINYTGTGSGLEFSSIALQSEVVKEFYTELPINISVSGNYHDFGTFVSGVAGLDRIVTLHDFVIVGGDNNNSVLSMNITARTYRYNDVEE